MKPEKQPTNVPEEDAGRRAAERNKEQSVHDNPDPAVKPMNIGGETSGSDRAASSNGFEEKMRRRFDPRSIAIAAIIAIVIVLLLVWML